MNENLRMNEHELRLKVTEMLHNMGIPAHIKGYQYIREAVILVYQDWGHIESVTKLLYPALARRFDSSTSKVERAIRHAIEIACERGMGEVKKFIPSLSECEKPTNSELIAAMADYLLLNN